MRNLYFSLTFLCFLTSFAQSKTQFQIDSLLVELPQSKNDTAKINTLNNLAHAYKKFNNDKAEKYALQALALAQKIKWNDGIANSYFRLGSIYFKKMNYEKAAFYFKKSLKSTTNKKINGKTLADLGLLYKYQSNYTKALECNHQSLNLCQEIRDKEGVALALGYIGTIYYELLQYKKAIFYIEKAVKINQQNNILINLGNNFYWLGITYVTTKEYEKAENYFLKAIEISTELGDNFNKSLYLGELINAYFTDKKYDKSLQYTNQLQQLESRLGLDNSNLFCLGISGEIYTEKAKGTTDKKLQKEYLQKALSCFSKSLSTDKALGNTKEIAVDYELISENQYLQHDYKAALESYHSSIIYKDSVFNYDTKETIKNIEDKQTIALRDKELKFSKLNLETKEKQKWYFILGLLSLGIIGGLLYYQSNNRKRTNKKLKVLNADLNQANKVKTKVLSILNHDLRSPVNSFIHYIQLKKESPELLDEASKLRIENTTLASAKNLLDSMEDILLWTKDQMENFGPQPKLILISSLFDNMKNHFSNIKNIQISYENINDIQLTTDENYLKIIIRNLTENAIKALRETKNPTIIWKAWHENNSTYLSITDNGFGVRNEELKALYDDKEAVGIKSGLGLHLIRDLALAINCKITVDSNYATGTVFTLIIS